MTLTVSRLMIVAVMASVLLGCATKRPVLYPNRHYKTVGVEVAQADIDECMHKAKTHGLSPKRAEKVAGRTAGGAAAGAAVGAAVGAVRGNAGGGAATGAAGGGAGGLVGGVFRSRDPDPLFKNFVQRCLQDRGYELIGWR